MSDFGRAVLELTLDGSGFHKGLADIKTQAGGLEGTFASLGKFMAGAFTVTAIVGAGKSLLDFAGKLTDMKAKTDISTTGLQKLDLAFEGSGVSLEQVTKAAGELGARLVAGDKGVVGAVSKLGLNLQQLKTMRPEDQFIAVADAVGKIQNQGEQLLASKTLFGKGGVELLSGLTGHLKETTDEMARMGLVIDEETIDAADNFGDQLGLMGKQLLGIVATVVGPLLPALSGLASVLMSVAQVVGDVTGFFVDWIQKGLVAAYAAIARFIGGLADAATSIPILGKHLGFASDAAKFLRESADSADKHLAKLFTTTGDVSTGSQKAAGSLIGMGDAVEGTGQKAKKAADEYGKMMKSVAKADSDAANARGMAQMEEYTAAQERKKKNIEGQAQMDQDAWALELAERQRVAGEKAAIEAAYETSVRELANETGLALMEADRQRLEAMQVSWETTLAGIGEAFGQFGVLGVGVLGQIGEAVLSVTGLVSRATASVGSLKDGFARMTTGGGLTTATSFKVAHDRRRNS